MRPVAWGNVRRGHAADPALARRQPDRPGPEPRPTADLAAAPPRGGGSAPAVAHRQSPRGCLLDAYFGVYTSAGNQAETLTGRTAIWAWALDAGLSHPWLGNGFDAMWKVAPPFGSELFEARHAENEILQQFFAYEIGRAQV